MNFQRPGGQLESFELALKSINLVLGVRERADEHFVLLLQVLEAERQMVELDI
jgi:hypothetical protein